MLPVSFGVLGFIFLFSHFAHGLGDKRGYSRVADSKWKTNQLRFVSREVFFFFFFTIAVSSQRIHLKFNGITITIDPVLAYFVLQLKNIIGRLA